MTEMTVSLDRILSFRQGGTGPIVNVDEPVIKLVIVSVGDQWFAFPGGKIKEILADCPVFFLPGCPPSLEGVINVRGDIESVIGLRAVLGLEESAAAPSSRILLAQAASMRSGIRVDQVEEVVDVIESSVKAPPHTIAEHLRPVVLGIVEFRDHLVHLLDLEHIFEDYRAGLR